MSTMRDLCELEDKVTALKFEVKDLEEENARLKSELKDEAQKKATLEPLLANLKYEWGEWKRTIENHMADPEDLVKAIDDVIAVLTP